jgi:hypothetical protein
MTKKVHKLKDEKPDSFKVIAIASHENHYRLTWMLNEALQYDFRKIEDLEVTINNQFLGSFNRYRFENRVKSVNFDLISNHSENGFLLKDQKNIDFLIKVTGEVHDFNLNQFTNEIRKIKNIITAFVLEDLSKINQKKLTY